MSIFRRYEMQDRSGGRINRTDSDLSILSVFNMTDFTEEEANAVLELAVGEELLLGSEQDISVRRIA